MLEIYLMWRLAKYIGNEATQKGFKRGRYQLMAVLLWIVGEWTGAVLGGVIFENASSIWPVYSIALIGAILGAAVAFLVMRLLPTTASLEKPIASVTEEEPIISMGFARSGWVPTLVIVLAFFCLCLVLIGASIIYAGTLPQ